MPTNQLSDDDRDAITDIVRRASDAQTDPDLLLPLHTPDVTIVNIVGRRVLGREALGEATPVG